jgi:uncharacterized protein with HEPN domain
MQLRNQKLKYILDIESVIGELEQIIELHDGNFQKFVSSFIALRAVERDLMIIGEAISNIIRLDKDAAISSAKDIVGLRNIIVHAYDAIDPALLWKILIKDLPVLKEEVSNMKG